MYSRMDQVKIFKGRLPQVLLGPFLNILTQMYFVFSSNRQTLIITFVP